MERQYDKVLRLIREANSNLKELKEIFNRKQEHEITNEEFEVLDKERKMFIEMIKEFAR